MTNQPFIKELSAEDVIDFLKEQCFSITINANDFFSFACADAERISTDNIERLLEVYCQYGHPGVSAFMSLHRGKEPAEGDEKYGESHPKYLEAKKSLESYRIQKD